MNNQVAKPGLMDRFKNRKRPGKPWVLLVAAALIAASFIVVFMVYQMGSSSSIKGEARTKAMRNDVKSTPGGDASQAYREKVEELNRKNAESAEQEGRSYISSVEGQLLLEGPPEPEEQKDEQPREAKPEPDRDTSDEPSAQVRAMEKRMRQMQERMEAMQQQQQYQRQQSTQSQHRTNRPERDYSQQYGKQLAQLTAELDQDFAGQQVVAFEEASYTEGSGSDPGGNEDHVGSGPNGSKGSNGQNEEGEEDSGPEVTAGDVLYARNEILLNSDAPGPAQATVLAGDFQGATLLGGFDKTGDYLSVKFSRLVLPNGDDYKVEGVAIDPEVSATAVRSDVNRHILSRWGGLMGASFLAGFGDAVQSSGSEIAVSDGTTVSSQPDLDTEQELWAAAGRVGEELSSVMKKNFDRPSTVKLAPGTNIGILFLSAEKNNN